jgi:hypothetical protein
MKGAFEDQNWEKLKGLDKELGERLDDAFEDKGRDTLKLVKELESVLSLYAEMVESMPDRNYTQAIAPVKK